MVRHTHHSPCCSCHFRYSCTFDTHTRTLTLPHSQAFLSGRNIIGGYNQTMRSNMLDVVQVVPVLADQCASSKCLRELRSICRTTRAIAAQYVNLLTGLTVDFLEPFPNGRIELLAILGKCRLNRIGVILRLDSRGKEFSKVIDQDVHQGISSKDEE